MNSKWRKVIVMLLACAVAGAFSAPAFSTPLHPGNHPKQKCNSGSGNGSELVSGVDCDPGNSGAINNGRD